MMPKSISISRPASSVSTNTYETPENSISVVQEATHLNTPFSTEQLKQAWDSYLPKLANNGRLLSIFQSQYPVVVAENIYSIRVPNPSLQKEMLLIKEQLTEFLHRQLKNNQFQIRIEISQEMFANIPFTTEEKFKSMVEKNPVLARLKDELDLIPD